jgi:nucleotide-binding universal stress UspA family protein
MFRLAKRYVADLTALLGSVAHKVLHLSQRPVLIAR